MKQQNSSKSTKSSLDTNVKTNNTNNKHNTSWRISDQISPMLKQLGHAGIVDFSLIYQNHLKKFFFKKKKLEWTETIQILKIL